jgi:hypothetical protein
MELYWFLQSVGYWSLVVLLVPFNYIKKLLLFSILGGFVYTWIVQYLAVDILGFWVFTPDVLMVLEIPFFFVFSWFAVTLLYGYFLYQYPKHQLWILILFISWATINNYVSLELNQMAFFMWSVVHTFMFAIFSHIILLFLLKLMHNIGELGPKDDILSFSLAVLNNKK